MQAGAEIFMVHASMHVALLELSCRALERVRIESVIPGLAHVDGHASAASLHRNRECQGGGARRGGPPPRPQAGGRGHVVDESLLHGHS
jgi:hypothetical protein